MYNPEDRIWNLWQYILLISWTIEYLRNQIKLLSLRTQYLYMCTDIQCIRLNPCVPVFPIVKLNTLSPRQCLPKPTKVICLCPQLHLLKASGLFCYFMMQLIFNKISHNEPAWRKRDTDSFPWRNRRTDAALTWCGFLLPTGRPGVSALSRASRTWEERSEGCHCPIKTNRHIPDFLQEALSCGSTFLILLCCGKFQTCTRVKRRM